MNHYSSPAGVEMCRVSETLNTCDSQSMIHMGRNLKYKLQWCNTANNKHYNTNGYLQWPSSPRNWYNLLC